VIEPRFAWFPPRERSLGAECCEFWRAAGGVLFDWQVFWIDGVLGLGDDDRFVSSDDGLCVARQNGKGVALQALELFFAFALGRKRGYKVIMHTAHEFATAQEHFFRLEDLIRNSPELHAMVKDKGGYMHANGRDSINLKDGTRIIFKARTSGGGRGYSADFLAWDEAMQIPAAVIGAQKPMLRASSAEFGPKTIYAGSAVDQEIHQNGVTFAFLRERGIENSPRVSFAEWSAPFDHPDQMTDGLLRDRRFWPCGNPSMADGLISEEWMADEIETTPGRVAAVEYDNVGDWPRTDGRIDTVISVEAWDSLVDLESALLPPYCLAIDVSPERQTSIALAGRNEEGLFHVEIQECRQGTGWAAKRVAEMVEHADGDILEVVCDAVGPAASLVVPLDELGVKVQTVSSSEHGQACGRLVDLVAERGLVHLGSKELREAILGASTRPLNDAWAWSRKNSRVDISPLVSATLALGAAAGITSADLAVF
jgi:hypothetical protein